ncbi:MAG: VOC family protein [Gammaproteobacteria bacterium]
MSKTKQTAPDPWLGFQRVIIGVADLDTALDLWVEEMGFDVLARIDGIDHGLDEMWGLTDNRVAAQALVRTPGQSRGALHLVQFQKPTATVREDANAFDLCPKNLDVHAKNIADRVHRLRRAGYEFRGDEPVSSTAPDGTKFAEMHMMAHDDINVVLLEIADHEMPFSTHGFAGISPLISVVPDAEEEKAFYKDILGLTCQSDNYLDGPDIERMIGLPKGTGLDVSIWGDKDALMGALEIVSYRGVDGANLYPQAMPPARGVLRVGLRTPDIGAWRKHLTAKGIEFENHTDLELRIARTDAVSFPTPAGLMIEIHQFS